MFLLTANAATTENGVMLMVGYVVVLGIMMYVLAIRPQKKQQQRHNELMSSLENGDYILTTSGFYGTVIDITEDTVIVEFGNNKNCRIPMKKEAIVEVEKPQ